MTVEGENGRMIGGSKEEQKEEDYEAWKGYMEDRVRGRRILSQH
jgi:hypothetical protein